MAEPPPDNRLQKFCIRKHLEQADVDQIYETYDNLFSIKLHHGGYFTKSLNMEYVEGKVSIVDLLNGDYFSMNDLDDILKNLDYPLNMVRSYHYLDPEGDLDFGLRALRSELDVIEFLKFVSDHRIIINVYTEFEEVPKPNAYKRLTEEVVKEFLADYNLDEEFDPFFGADANKNLIPSNVKHIATKIYYHSENENESGKNTDEDDDSDFDCDDNPIDDVEVDMRDFRLTIDKGVEESNANIDLNDEVLDNEILESGSDSDANESSVRKNMLKYLRNKNENKSNFYIGQAFGTKQEVKDLIKVHAVETRRKLRIIKDDHNRVRAVCWGDMPTFEPIEWVAGYNVKGGAGSKVEKGGEGSSTGGNKENKNVGGRGKKLDPLKHQCPWVILVSKEKDIDTWIVRTLVDEHKCHQSRNIKHCTSNFLAKQLMDQIEENPNIPVKAVQEQFQRKYEIGVSRMKAFRAKTKALTQLHGDYMSQYGLLRDYLQELMHNNPGTTVHIEVEPCTDPNAKTRKFKRVYVCLGSLKQGFKAIRRELLGLDGAFMKGPFPGQILTAVGLDPNNGIYPLSYAIVEAENLSSWTWFLECVGDDLDLDARSNFTFISDRQKGILPALAKVFPNAEHRYCLRHILENMKKTFKGKAYKDMLWKISTSTTQVYFEKEMDALKQFNSEAHLWLSNIPPQHWSRSHFSGRAHSDVLLNNMCECFNAKIVDGRDKPIITALEFIREYLMRRIVNVLKLIDKSDGLLTPWATKTFEVIKKDATYYTVQWNGEDQFQVTGPKTSQYVVDLRRRTCACRRWEITGIPCKHAVAAIWNKATYDGPVGMPETFVDPLYRLDRWKEVYSFKVYPINGIGMWSKCQVPTVLTPPTHHKPVGRPRKMRKKSTMELEEATKGGKLSKKGKTSTCQKCGNKGHNSRTCNGRQQEA